MLMFKSNTAVNGLFSAQINPPEPVTNYSTGFNNSYQCAISANQDVYVADNRYGNLVKVASDGVYTVHQTLSGVYGVAVDSDDNIYASSVSSKVVKKYLTNGTTVNWGSGFTYPTLLVVSGSRILYVADNTTVKAVYTNGTTSVFYTFTYVSGKNHIPMAFDVYSDTLYMVDYFNSALISYKEGGEISSTFYDQFTTHLRGITADGSGSLFLTYPTNTTKVYKMDLASGMMEDFGSGYVYPMYPCTFVGTTYVTDYLSGILYKVTQCLI